MVKIKLLKPWMAHAPGKEIEVHGVEADLLIGRGYAERVTESAAISKAPETTALSGPPETTVVKGPAPRTSRKPRK